MEIKKIRAWIVSYEIEILLYSHGFGAVSIRFESGVIRFLSWSKGKCSCLVL